MAYVWFSPYRPWLLEKDLAFFSLAESSGLRVEKRGERVVERVLFEEDPGVSESRGVLGGTGDELIGSRMRR